LLFRDIIRKKRDGGELTPEEIAFFVHGLADDSIPAEQVSALAMAVYLNSMSTDEASRLTLDMAASGSVLEWDDEGLDGPVVDKHSTGCGSLRLLCADDFRARPGPHRRDRGQSRIHTGLQRDTRFRIV
jgi:hypothetical protein